MINHTLYGAPGAPYGNSLVATPKLVDPPGEAWPDMKIIVELAKRVGYKLPFDSLESLYAWQLETVGVTFDEIMAKPQHHHLFGQTFKKYLEPGWKWNTPTGKIELYNYQFKKLGEDPLPDYKEDEISPLTRPDIFKEYPLIMGHHRERFYQNTERHNIKELRDLAGQPVIEIQPETAKGLGVKEGEWMWLESYMMPGERVKGQAKFVKEMHPNVVSMAQGWWFPENPGPDFSYGVFDYNINTIISDGPPYEAFNGHHQMRGIMCKGGKAK
jgi:anaerobic selenocysteine-containing dehydrogenase